MQRLLILCAVMIIPCIGSAESAPTVGVSEIEPTQVETIWGLDPDEIHQYRNIEPAIRSFVDPSITPLEVLGMYADSAQDRRAYAVRFVEANIKHTRKALEWGVYVEEAARSISLAQHLESSPEIQRSLSKEKTRLKKVQREWFGLDKPQKNSVFHSKIVQARGSLFVAPDCKECELKFHEQYKRVREGDLIGLDVVFADMGAPDRALISRWANTMGLDMGDVASRRVTLNYEGETWKAQRAGRPVPLFLGDSK